MSITVKVEIALNVCGQSIQSEPRTIGTGNEAVVSIFPLHPVIPAKPGMTK